MLFGGLASSGAPISFSVFGSSNTTWSESTLNYNNRPTTNTSALATATASSTTAEWFELDVTNYLKQQKAAGKQFVTLVLKGNAASSPYLKFASREAGANAPDAHARDEQHSPAADNSVFHNRSQSASPHGPMQGLVGSRGV